jgi:RNA polymerase sigma factor (TIGR02999 family)
MSSPASPNPERSPSSGTPHEITLLLRGVRPDDSAAADRLFPLLYDELRKMARAKLSHTPGGTAGQTLQATALVHEVYFKLVAKDTPAYENRRHFFFAAARAMQDILVDQYRRRAAIKRGGGKRPGELDSNDLAVEPPNPGDDVVGIADALSELERSDPRKAQIVRLRYFTGLSAEETAAALDVSLSTVEREWRFARALLHTMLARDDSGKDADR